MSTEWYRQRDIENAKKDEERKHFVELLKNYDEICERQEKLRIEIYEGVKGVITLVILFFIVLYFLVSIKWLLFSLFSSY